MIFYGYLFLNIYVCILNLTNCPLDYLTVMQICSRYLFRRLQGNIPIISISDILTSPPYRGLNIIDFLCHCVNIIYRQNTTN